MASLRGAAFRLRTGLRLVSGHFLFDRELTERIRLMGGKSDLP
ncbi:MAG: hypothetical protein ABSF61_11615 [Anaerolineales bacterium]|jgi:hypothetical protein